MDLHRGSFEQVIDWNDPSIAWEGRGLDRGLRGIAFQGDSVYLAASDELFVYDRHFKLQTSFRNPYLKHCHETFISGHALYLTSTGFDSVLEFDVVAQRFVRGWCLRHEPAGSRGSWAIPWRRPHPALRCRLFDPEASDGPAAGDTWHLNSVTAAAGCLFVSGTGERTVAKITGNEVSRYATIPTGSHNARPYRKGVIFNDTNAGAVRITDRNGRVLATFPVVHYPPEELLYSSLPKDHARQAFGRGLCTTGDLVIGGSSPATISVYDVARHRLLKTVNLSMDVRNAIHGLELWPF